MMGSQAGIQRSLRTVRKNPAQSQTSMSSEALAALEDFARARGVSAIGYARLPHGLIFRDKAVLYENAIVLTMEMDKAKIDTAPAPEASIAVHETYHHLGDAANEIADYVRARGYTAQAGHPLMGVALYPPLGQLAGLGWRGQHGMLITPEFGPRCRLAAVFTSIEDLPFCERNDHSWVESFCQSCGRCIRQCPPKAILETPIAHDNGLVTCTDVEKCFPYFLEHYGCSVCVKVCPFSEANYADIKERWESRPR
jgi:epoxyqueuosine reductase QueG